MTRYISPLFYSCAAIALCVISNEAGAQSRADRRDNGAVSVDMSVLDNLGTSTGQVVGPLNGNAPIFAQPGMPMLSGQQPVGGVMPSQAAPLPPGTLPPMPGSQEAVMAPPPAIAPGNQPPGQATNAMPPQMPAGQTSAPPQHAAPIELATQPELPPPPASAAAPAMQPMPSVSAPIMPSRPAGAPAIGVRPLDGNAPLVSAPPVPAAAPSQMVGARGNDGAAITSMAPAAAMTAPNYPMPRPPEGPLSNAQILQLRELERVTGQQLLPDNAQLNLEESAKKPSSTRSTKKNVKKSAKNTERKKSERPARKKTAKAEPKATEPASAALNGQNNMVAAPEQSAPPISAPPPAIMDTPAPALSAPPAIAAPEPVAAMPPLEPQNTPPAANQPTPAAAAADVATAASPQNQGAIPASDPFAAAALNVPPEPVDNPPAEQQQASLPPLGNAASDPTPAASGALLSLSFAADQEKINDAQKAEISKIVAALTANPNSQIVIDAMASGSSGNSARRVALNRAMSLRQAILDELPADQRGSYLRRLNLRALGDSSPAGAVDRVDVSQQ